MYIKDILAKQFTVSFEVFPPKINDTSPVINTIHELIKHHPDFISVTCGAGGTTKGYTAEVAAEIEKCNIPALAHLTCIGLSREEIDNTVQSLISKNIQNILALRGDIPENNSKISYVHASDLIPIVKSYGFCVGAAAYPEGHPESPNRDIDLDNIQKKVDAGVDFLTTQMFFNNDILYSFLYRLQSRNITVPVLAGIMPVTSINQIKRITRLSNATIPAELLELLNGDNPYQAGISYAVHQIIDLIAYGVRGVHIYTMNNSQIADAIIGSMETYYGT
jgi:methylenetetrahydrofolate reductase (NADPH)